MDARADDGAANDGGTDADDAAPPDAPSMDTGARDSAMPPPPPLARVVFPRGAAIVPRDTLTVRGTADPSEVATVSVDGLEATTADAFATWRVEVPIPRGAHVLNVEVETADGTTISMEDTRRVIGVGWVYEEPSGIALDTSRDRLLVSDRGALLTITSTAGDITLIRRFSASLSIVGYDPLRDEAVVVEPGGVVSGVSLSTTDVRSVGTIAGSAATVDAPRDRLVYATGDRVDALDLATGIASTLSAGGTLPAIPSPRHLVASPDGSVAHVFDTSTDTVVRVDLSTGTRMLVSGASRGDGPTFSELDFLELDTATGELLGSNESGLRLLAIDPGSGDRRLVASGGELIGARDGVLFGRQLVIPSWSRGWIQAVDVDTGDVTRFSETRLGEGAALRSSTSVSFDSNRNRYLVTSASRISGTVYVSGATGNRTTTTVAGPSIGGATASAYDSRNDIFAVLSEDGDVVYYLDARTSGTRVLSSDVVGTGPSLGRAGSLAFDGSGRLLVAAPSEGLVEIDVRSGDRSVVSAGSLQSDALAIDSGGVRAFFHSGFCELSSADLATGARTPFGSTVCGPTSIGYVPSTDTVVLLDGDGAITSCRIGPATCEPVLTTRALPVERPSKAVLHPEEQILVFADSRADALMATDLLTGEQVVTSR
jgi:hypothetical protein